MYEHFYQILPHVNTVTVFTYFLQTSFESGSGTVMVFKDITDLKVSQSTEVSKWLHVEMLLSVANSRCQSLPYK